MTSPGGVGKRRCQSVSIGPQSRLISSRGNRHVTEGELEPAHAALVADARMAMRRLPPGVSIDVLRAAANAFMASAAGPELWRVSDRTIDAGAHPLRLRIYEPQPGGPRPYVLFLHGGGFIIGNLSSHDGLCRRLAAATGLPFVAVDYRLAPEDPFPAALEDALAATAWLREHGGELGLAQTLWAVAGDSAGGQLALATALRADALGHPPKHAALLYPLLDPTRSTASAHSLAEGYMLTGSFIDWAWEAYAGGADLGDDPLFDLRRADLSRLPSMRIATAEFDPLRDEGDAFAQVVNAAGGTCVSRRYPGVIHGFAAIPPLTAQAGEAVAFLAEGLRASLSATA